MKNIGRNKMFSLASIATMAACIFLFGIFFSVVTNFKTMVKTAEEGVAVTVFFEKGIEQDKIDEIGKEIKKRPEVAKYDFVSADEAWKDFQPGRYSVSEPYSGYVRMIHNYGMDEQSSFALRVETPAPFNLLALVLDVEL